MKLDEFKKQLDILIKNILGDKFIIVELKYNNSFINKYITD